MGIVVNVIIVEDNPADASVLSNMLARYSAENGVQFRTAVYGDAYAFLESYRADADVIFMDIELPGMNGMDEPMAKNMSFQREYAEPYDWVAQQFKDWAFTLTTAFFYYNDYAFMGEDERGLHRKAMAAFGGIAPSYHIELLDKPTIYWDFHSLLLGIQMMFSFMLVDGDQPLRLCKHCQKVFLGSRSNAAFCSPRCKNQYNVYKSRGKNNNI